MSNYILNLDSRYRNVFEYTNPAVYDIIVNPYVPPGNSQPSNTSFQLENPVFTTIQWSGNVSFPVSSIWSGWTDMPNNAVFGRTTRFFGTTRFELSESQRTSVIDYYVGCLFLLFVPTSINQTAGTIPQIFQTALITNYDTTLNLITIQTAFDTVFLGNVLTATVSNPLFRNYYILNTSHTRGLNLVLLGLNNFLETGSVNLLSDLTLQTAPTSVLYVQNVTKNWVARMNSLDSFTRTAFLTPIQSSAPIDFDLSDIFALRLTPTTHTVEMTDNGVYSLVKDAVIVYGGSGYSVGQVVSLYTQTTPPVMTTGSVVITGIDHNTGVVTFVWNTRMSGQSVSEQYQIGNGTDPAILMIVSVCELALPVSFHDGRSTEKLVTSYDGQVVVQIPLSPISSHPYVTSFAQYQDVVYDFTYDTSSGNTSGLRAYICVTQYIGASMRPPETVPKGTFLQLTPYRGSPVGVIAPAITYQQGVCYRIRLLSLILPNLPIVGSDQLPSFFPYFFLELYNTQIMNGSSNILYTNNPHTQRVSFFCPVANPRNPLTSSYVVVRSTQENIVKWTSFGNIHFEVTLPDGTPLKYNFTQRIQDVKTVFQEENLGFQSFMITLVGQLFEGQVVGTFEFIVVT